MKLILVAALTVLLLVWARNLLIFMPGSSTTETHYAPPEQTSLSGSRDATDGASRELPFTYDTSTRDPFLMPSLRPEKTRPKQKRKHSTPRIASSPRASLQGIVWNASKPYAIVFDSVTNSSLILSSGDSINDYVVVSIKKEQISLRQSNTRISWEVPH